MPYFYFSGTATVIIVFSSSSGGCSGSGVPRITEHPEDTYVAKNDPVTLRCSASGDPEPDITWWKDGRPVVTAATDVKSHRVLLPRYIFFILDVNP